MKNVIYCLLLGASLTFSTGSMALIPLEGLIFGDVEDAKQFDPLRSILSQRFETEKDKTSLNVNQSKYYYGVYKQGSELLAYCEQNPQLRYLNQWQQASAARSVAATLQYIGIDKSLKAIAGYAKKLEYSLIEYNQLTDNLITNTCSKNLSVYSLKLLRNNFKFAFAKPKPFDRSLAGTDLYFSDDYKLRQDTMETLKREFEYTLRNFRAFCSWGGDTSDYRMLVPYLKNPFIMSIVFNHLQKKKMSLAPKTQQIILSKNDSGIQVACEDLICRSRSVEEFKRVFPRMTGSTELKDDLYGLYCEAFARTRYQRNQVSPQILKWIKEQTPTESKIEALQFLSLLTEIPDGLIVASNFKGLEQFFIDNIKGRWDNWSKVKLKQFFNDHMYEEPLEIKIVELGGSNQVLRGEFAFLFNIGLSEIDKVLNEIDKIDTVFYLDMPVKYLAYIKERSQFLTRNSHKKKWDRFFVQVVNRLHYQMKLKKALYKVPIWTNQIAVLMADELISQVKSYNGTKLQRLSAKNIKIPVRMRLGIFALRYVREKYKYLETFKPSLTFK